jgi:hypothetical protein
MQQTAILENYAEQYYNAGFSIIGLNKRDKTPLGSWKKYQTDRAAIDQVSGWFANGNNIGLVMGAVSGGIVALDFDQPGAFEEWGEANPALTTTAIAKTGKGYHVLFKMDLVPGNKKMFWRGKHVGETRGEGGYIVVAPSIHPNGHQYLWITPPWESLLTIKSLADAGIELEAIKQPVSPAPADGHHPLPPRTLNFVSTGAVNGAGVNEELYQAALQYGAAGYSEWETISQLMPVAHLYYIGKNAGNTERQAEQTIKSGWKNGLDKEPIKAKNTVNSNGNGHKKIVSDNLHEVDVDFEAEALATLTRPTYAEVDGCMVYTTYKTIDGNIIANKRIIAPFVARITEKHTVFDDNDQTVTYTLAGNRGNQNFSTSIEADDWADQKRLTSVLLNKCLPGLPPDTDPNLRKFWGSAIAALSNAEEMKEVKSMTCTGWAPDGKAFVLPGGAIGTGYTCQIDKAIEPEMRNFQLQQRTEPEMRTAIVGLLSLLKIYKPAVIYTLIAHAFLPPLMKYVGDDVRYMYHIHAETGSLKTELAKLIMALYGPLGTSAITYKWSNTPYGAESRAHALKDCLMLIDDLKPGAIPENDKSKWVAFVQAAVDAMGRKRATMSGKAAVSLPPRALLLSTGETVPEAGEESFTARMLLGELDKRPDNEGRCTWLDEIKTNAAPLFSGVMYAYIEWLLAGNGQGAVDEYRKLQLNGALTKHQRLASNVASNRLGAIMFCKFCVASGLFSARMSDIFLTSHAAGLDAVLDHTAQRAHEERYSQRFVSALRDALETGYCKLSAIQDDRRVGWADNTHVYVLNGAKEIVDQWLRSSGQSAINIAKPDLRRQLYNDGLSNSTAARVKAGQYDYQAMDPATQARPMVIALYKSKFSHEIHETHEVVLDGLKEQSGKTAHETHENHELF